MAYIGLLWNIYFMENTVTLKLIDRQKRIVNKLIAYLGLVPAGLFFISCFRVGRHSIPRETIWEREFNFESYWRTIGVIGLVLTLVLYVFLDKLIPYKKGKIQLTRNKIVIDRGERGAEDFEINKLTDFEFKTDVPFDTDDRDGFQKASILKFKSNNKKFDLEINVETATDLESLTPIIKSWNDVNKEFRYGYK